MKPEVHRVAFPSWFWPLMGLIALMQTAGAVDRWQRAHDLREDVATLQRNVALLRATIQQADEDIKAARFSINAHSRLTRLELELEAWPRWTRETPR